VKSQLDLWDRLREGLNRIRRSHGKNTVPPDPGKMATRYSSRRPLGSSFLRVLFHQGLNGLDPEKGKLSPYVRAPSTDAKNSYYASDLRHEGKPCGQQLTGGVARLTLRPRLNHLTLNEKPKTLQLQKSDTVGDSAGGAHLACIRFDPRDGGGSAIYGTTGRPRSLSDNRVNRPLRSIRHSGMARKTAWTI